MPIPVKQSIDFNLLELLNATAENLASPPAHKAGRFYYDTALQKLGISTGVAWVYVGDGGSVLIDDDWYPTADDYPTDKAWSAWRTSASIDQVYASIATGTVRPPVFWAAFTTYFEGTYVRNGSDIFRVNTEHTSTDTAPTAATSTPLDPDSFYDMWATSSAVANTLTYRASDGSATYSRVYATSAPIDANELVRKDYVDGVTAPTRGQFMLIVWNGSAWTYEGNVITAQPANRRTYDRAFFIGNPGGAAPSWMMTNDIWTQG